MPDEIKQRLKDSADACIQSYEAWFKDKKKAQTREALQEAVHEMRKVASRLEIELATSDRDQMASNPIPIPPHRDARGRHQKSPGNETTDGNSKSDGQDKKPSKPRRRSPKKAAEG